MKKFKKIFLYFFTSMILLLLIVFLFYPPKYVYRVLVWQDADYDDYKNLKYNIIKKADKPFEFVNGSEEQRVNLLSKFQEIDEIDDFENFLETNKTYAFLVVKNDTILYEKYFNNQSREDLQTSFSASKSLLSLLVGIAIQKGKIESVNDPITNYLPELTEQDPRFTEIKISDLLKMKSGIAYDSKVKFPILNCDDPLTYYHTDLRKMVIDNVEIEQKAGELFKYNNYNAILIGLILERSTGEQLSTFFEKNLWQKIGASYDASWSTDENDFEKMESGFNARPIDLAKVGSLMLKNGNWYGSSIISSDWISESTKPLDTLTFRSGQKWGYSYMWWSVIKDSTEVDVFGNGRFGQFLYLSPENNIIIIRHGLESDNLDDDDWTQLFQNFITEINH
ncbi:MAG: serine hydrolase [Flavobacteriaceae bacterium]|nr:serine hydrolase [Flavobacteriaceae bacterium]